MINDYLLRLTGGVSMESELDPSKRHNIKSGEFDIYSVEKRDNQDGTFTLVYKGKFVSALEIDESGKPIRGTDKTAKSRKLRGAIWWLAQEEKADDSDAFYQIVMDKLINNINEVWQFVKKL